MCLNKIIGGALILVFVIIGFFLAVGLIKTIGELKDNNCI